MSDRPSEVPDEIVFRVWRDELNQFVAYCPEPELRAYGADRDALVEAIHEAIRRHYQRPELAPRTIRLHHSAPPPPDSGHSHHHHNHG